MNFGFETIGFKRIQFSTDNENLWSQKSLEKIGAHREGLFRNNNVAPRGESRSDVYYSIIKEEWEALKTEIFPEFIVY